MKEYLPRETEETDQILEAEAAGAGGGSRRRRKSGSMGKEVSLCIVGWVAPLGLHE